MLQADLDCSSSPFGVRLLRRATLDLNGHTIAGGDATVATVAGVGSRRGTNPIGTGRGDFTILGPGSITGTAHPPLNQTGTKACVLLNDGRAIISGGGGTVEIRGCIFGVRGARLFTPSGFPPKSGPNGRGRVTLDHAAIRDNSDGGVIVHELTATDVLVEGNGKMGLGVGRQMTVHNVTAQLNDGIGLFGAELLQGSDVTATENTNNGVDTCGFGRLELVNLVATGNGLFGACGDVVHLTDSTVLENSLRDIGALVEAPVLVNVTCGTSANQNLMPWNVCADD